MLDDERARLAALRRYRILDTDPERAFDDLTLLASQICGTPIALITLIDADRQWFKSRKGVTVQQTSRSIAFCAHAIQQRDLFVVPDAQQDDAFRENPLVTGDPYIRFYAGAPLVTPDGHALGTICVIDRVPRTLTAEQREALDALRRQAQAQLELRLDIEELNQALAARDEAEATQRRLIEELRASIENVKRLSALVPFLSTCEFNLVIPADPSAIPTVTDGVAHILQDKNWPEAEIMKVELAVQEALANAIRHGCRGDATKEVQCVVTFDASGALVIVVKDSGDGFERAKVAHPLAPENMLKPSGRGIFLINQLMDEVDFADEGRQIQMRKRLDKPATDPATQ